MDETLTLGHLAGTGDVAMEGEVPGGPVRIARDAAGRLSYPEIPSLTEQYLRGVAMALGLGSKTMKEEAFVGMVNIYAKLINTPLKDARLQA